MKIAILGTRGVPNYHGGFEQFAEYFSVYLANNNHDLYVYNSSTHPFKEKYFKGVNIIHCIDLENRIGTIGQFVYDLNCILDARRRDFDIILQLGYTSNSIWCKLLPKKAIIVTNMDGLEWKRSKYSGFVRKFLKYAEKLAVKSSDYLISDSVGIQDYIKKTYDKPSEYIAYGAKLFDSPDENIIKEYGLNAYRYNMLIARLEPENNIEVILDGVNQSNSKAPFLVVGKHDVNSFGKYLKDKYKKDKRIHFIGGVYDIEILNNLRYFSNLYFHGHSVGGTNPSLLEAMASKALIIAHDNKFNKSILNEDALYFRNVNDVSKYLNSYTKNNYNNKVDNCFKRIEEKFNWNLINNKYLEYLSECYNNNIRSPKN